MNEEHSTMQAIIKLITDTDIDGEYSVYHKAKAFDEIADLLAKHVSEVLDDRLASLRGKGEAEK